MYTPPSVMYSKLGSQVTLQVAPTLRLEQFGAITKELTKNVDGQEIYLGREHCEVVQLKSMPCAAHEVYEEYRRLKEAFIALNVAC